MLSRVLYGMLLLILATSPTIAAGQDMPSGKWWRDQRMSKQLNLNKAEKNKLDQAFVNSRRKLIELNSIVEKERFELENILENETLDEHAVKEQFKKLEKARASLAGERFNFLVQVRKILGNERFRSIKMFYGQLRHQKMHRKIENPRASNNKP